MTKLRLHGELMVMLSMSIYDFIYGYNHRKRFRRGLNNLKQKLEKIN